MSENFISAFSLDFLPGGIFHLLFSCCVPSFLSPCPHSRFSELLCYFFFILLMLTWAALSTPSISFDIKRMNHISLVWLPRLPHACKSCPRACGIPETRTMLHSSLFPAILLDPDTHSQVSELWLEWWRVRAILSSQVLKEFFILTEDSPW